MNSRWYFNGGDFPQLFRCYKLRSVRDFLDFFIHGSLDSYASLDHPFEFCRQTFFSVYYRPLSLIFYFLEYSLFGLNAYMHFMFLIFFHSVITSMFCYFIIPFTGNFFAILFSLFFAFHPSHYLIGTWDHQQHIFATFFAILAVIFLIKKIRMAQSKNALPLASYIFFFFSLCTRETFVVFPLIAILIMNLYEQSQYYRFKKITTQLKILIGFGLTVLGYCFLRQIAYPIVFSSGETTGYLHMFFTRYLTMDTIRCLYLYFLGCFHPLYSVHFFELHNLLWLYRLIKIFTLSIPLILFFTSTKKKLILILAACTGLLFWPVIICGYGSFNDRSFYEPSILFMLSFISLFKFTFLKKYRFARFCGVFVLSFFVVYNFVFFIQGRRRYFDAKESSFLSLDELKKSAGKTLQYTPLFIFNLPTEVSCNSCVPHSLEIYGISKVAVNCYWDHKIRICGSNIGIKNDLLIRVDKNSYRFTTLDKKKLWFNCVDSGDERSEAYIHDKDDFVIIPFQENKIYDISIVFNDKKYFHHDAKFLTWDYKNNKFIVLNSIT